MNIFLHVCCGPCTIYPLYSLREKGFKVTGHFFNPNIHPFIEFKRRLKTVQDFANGVDFPIIFDNNYGLKEFIRKIAYNEDDRCSICYSMRLLKTVVLAKELAFDAFSTTLLYSKYQNHSKIVSLCEKLSSEYNLPFYYQDFRHGWQQAIDESKKLEMYRQPYCGCIYSEHERYDKTLHKK